MILHRTLQRPIGRHKLRQRPLVRRGGVLLEQSGRDERLKDKPINEGRGKGRAHSATERTALLGGSRSPIPADDDELPPTTSTTSSSSTRRRLIPRLAAVFLGTLLFCVLLLVALALLGLSYASRASHVSADDILQQGLVFEGPDRVDVLNVTWLGGIWVNVEARVGFDAGAVIGVNAAPDDGDGFFEGIWKGIGRWGVRSVERVSVNMTTIQLTSQHDPSIVLATIESTPVVVPLPANPPKDSTWLTRISTPLLLRLTHNTSALFQFVREAWSEGVAAVKADVGNVDVRGGGLGESSWRSMIHSELSDVQTALRIHIPPIPGIPHNGQLSDLVTLQSFSVYSAAETLSLVGCATIPDPAPTTFNLTTPSIPFTISLPSTDGLVPIAAVSTAPFTLTHPNITLEISGAVLPLPPTSTSLLSAFVSRYLSGLPNPIVVSTSLIPDLSIVNLEFPAPNPRPRILRGGAFTASGTIYARVVLPRGMDIQLHVGHILPDVLVFDGKVSDSQTLRSFPFPGTSPPTSPPLPDPLPERAFARICPEDWTGEGAAYAVTAKIVDVPLEVLPGTQKEFRAFISKVIFGSGAIAGILGTADVAIDVAGLPFPGPGEGERGLELHGLPFRGAIPVGKKSLKGVGDWRRGEEEVKKRMERWVRGWPWRREKEKK
ncbi:hypothetical protein FB45DRAFT_980035 [Roridomyces roridus]|uniref:Uncharacterized protein n=1 Tax=Roridomyces roridus TaxID=1738132 RepID=A0AAD7BLL6_9AGAR|nr:hypothetical protein FB45DRAFT_980035 [Roridomyces roridus]